jgi:hypothetical protein
VAPDDLLVPLQLVEHTEPEAPVLLDPNRNLSLHLTLHHSTILISEQWVQSNCDSDLRKRRLVGLRPADVFISKRQYHE